MSEDVYSQLLRQIDEAQHRGHLEIVSAEMFRLSKRDALTIEEFRKLARLESRKRVELIDMEIEKQRREASA